MAIDFRITMLVSQRHVGDVMAGIPDKYIKELDVAKVVHRDGPRGTPGSARQAVLDLVKSKMSRIDIIQALSANGHAKSSVINALGWLKKTGQLKSAGRGQFVPGRKGAEK